MEDVASVITAIAAVGWPLVIALLVWKLLPILKSRLSSGDVTVKMPGLEVSLQDASENFAKQLADLQDKVAQLRIVAAESHPNSLDAAPAALRNEKILWVDDHPANNAFEIGRLRGAGIPVDQVSSTDEALASLTHQRYTKVITDLEREENGRAVPQAGIELIKRMRENDIETPVFVYCSRAAIDLYGDKVKDAGAFGVTSSPLELFEQFGMSAGSNDSIARSEAPSSAPRASFRASP
jgi:CheY-like chemotaxis protein